MLLSRLSRALPGCHRPVPFPSSRHDRILGRALWICEAGQPHVGTTIVLHPHDISLAEDLATIGNLDTIGCHLFWDMLQADVAQVELWGHQVLEATRGASKRSQLWLQNFNINERNAAAMEMAFAGILNLEPDELGCFYFWRNNVDPTQVWDSTRRLLKRVPRRQLHWRMYTSPLPVPRPMNITLPSRDRKQAALLPITTHQEHEPVATSTALLADDLPEPGEHEHQTGVTPTRPLPAVTLPELAR